MSERRPRNVVSRNAALALRAAELLDDGHGDAAVAAKLNEEFKRTGADRIKAKAVFSFRHADYERVRAERQARSDAAAEARLIIESARDAGATFAQAGTDLLAKIFYDVVRKGGATMEPKELAEIGRQLAKFREVENATVKVQIEKERAEIAMKAERVATDANLSAEEKSARMREIFGMK